MPIENVRLSRRDADRHAGAPPHSSLQRISLDRLRWPWSSNSPKPPKKLASPRWPQPVAESYPRCRVRRRNRGYRTARSSRGL